MNKSINKKECVTTSNIWWKFAWLIPALYMTLWFPSTIKAESNNEEQQANFTDVIKPSDSAENSKVIDFDTAKMNFEKNFSNAEIDSLMAEYKNEYFQYLNSLSEQERRDLIMEISMWSDKIKETIIDLLNDENIINGIKLWNKNAVDEKIVKMIRNYSIRFALQGLIWAILASIVLELVVAGLEILNGDSINIWKKIERELCIIGMSSILSIIFFGIARDWEKDKIQNIDVNNLIVDNPTVNIDTANVIDFDTAIITYSKNDAKYGSEIDVKSKIEKYRNEYFQYWDKLTEQEKNDFILELFKKSDLLKKIFNDMLNNEDVVNAVKLWDEEYIQKKFLCMLWNEGFICVGICAVLLWWFFYGKWEERF